MNGGEKFLGYFETSCLNVLKSRRKLFKLFKVGKEVRDVVERVFLLQV